MQQKTDPTGIQEAHVGDGPGLTCGAFLQLVWFCDIKAGDVVF